MPRPSAFQLWRFFPVLPQEPELALRTLSRCSNEAMHVDPVLVLSTCGTGQLGFIYGGNKPSGCPLVTAQPLERLIVQVG